MAVELVQALTISASIWIFILLVLLVIWAFQPPKKELNKNQKSGRIKGDLKKIKDQINGDD
jgi:cbb3-type cytochrome oxidase subunit 3